MTNDLQKEFQILLVFDKKIKFNQQVSIPKRESTHGVRKNLRREEKREEKRRVRDKVKMRETQGESKKAQSMGAL